MVEHSVLLCPSFFKPSLPDGAIIFFGTSVQLAILHRPLSVAFLLFGRETWSPVFMLSVLLIPGTL